MESVTLTIPAPADPSPKATPPNVKDGPNGSKVVSPPAPKPDEPERPAWLPEKFKSGEDLVKSYAELEKKLSATPKAPEPKAAEPSASIDFNALTQEYNANGGKLTDASLAALQAKGFSKADIETYIAGKQAQVSSIMTAAHAAAGGEDKLKSAMAWANANMSEADRAAFNAATATNDPARVKLAVQGLMSSYTAAVGKDGTLVRGGEPAAGTGGALPFESLAQQIAAQSDKRYRKDPAFRQKVIDRIAATRNARK